MRGACVERTARGAARAAARTVAWARTRLSIESGDGSRSMSSSFEEAASLVVRNASGFPGASAASAPPPCLRSSAAAAVRAACASAIARDIDVTLAIDMDTPE